MTHQSVVYFARSGRGIKVGKTTRLVNRKYEIKTLRGKDIKYLGVVPESVVSEIYIKSLFLEQGCHISGEWFKPTDIILSMIEAITKDYKQLLDILSVMREPLSDKEKLFLT
jgi:hypothetical protein